MRTRQTVSFAQADRHRGARCLRVASLIKLIVAQLKIIFKMQKKNPLVDPLTYQLECRHMKFRPRIRNQAASATSVSQSRDHPQISVVLWTGVCK